MNYEKSFKNRIQSYLYAINTFPNVLNEEFKTAIKQLNLQSNDTILNIPGGGIPLDKYIDPKLNINYIVYDTHKEFQSKTIKYCEWNNIPLLSCSVDKIICLASLHHLNIFERINIYKEFYRILKPNGQLIIGDVINNSAQAKWLNNFVNKYNSNGHKGIFFNETDANLIEQQNFHVETIIEHYDWIFDNDKNAMLFCKYLFGLDLINENNDYILKNAIEHILKYKNGKIPWKLIYFICSKSIKNPDKVLY